MAKAVVTRKAVVGYPAIAEHKVAGEVYIPGVDAVPCDPGEVTVAMTIEDAQALYTILGRGVCTAGNTNKSGSEVWTALGAIGMARDNPFVWNRGSISGGARSLVVGHGYLTDTRLPPEDRVWAAEATTCPA